MVRRLNALVSSMLGLLIQAAPAHAMQFEQVEISATEVIIGGRGPIVSGDQGRLDQAIAAVEAGQQLVALAFDSPGGSVEEAKQLFAVIEGRRLAVVIPHNSKCASACFLLLVASPHRLAAIDALVGVHSASDDGTETDLAWVVTRQMARDSAALGVPPAIIGKMVQTTPGRVEWLTPADLKLMNVTVFEGDVSTAVRQGIAAGQAVGTPAATDTATAAVPAAPVAPAFPLGRDDRGRWNAWLAQQTGAYRQGAEYALTQIVAGQPGSCLGANGASRGDFTQGCTAAWQRLSAVAPRLRGSADYAAGWNSSSGTLAETRLVMPGRVEAEYQGAYFCGTTIGRLTVQLLPQDAGARRQAVFRFGPEATSRQVPHGAFDAEGIVDPRAGLTLQPTRWVQQPSGYSWFGLDGRSDDDGRTYSGRVTGKTTCTTFTLRRVSHASATR